MLQKKHILLLHEHNIEFTKNPPTDFPLLLFKSEQPSHSVIKGTDGPLFPNTINPNYITNNGTYDPTDLAETVAEDRCVNTVKKLNTQKHISNYIRDEWVTRDIFATTNETVNVTHKNVNKSTGSFIFLGGSIENKKTKKTDDFTFQFISNSIISIRTTNADFISSPKHTHTADIHFLKNHHEINNHFYNNNNNNKINQSNNYYNTSRNTTHKTGTHEGIKDDNSQRRE